jgi:hypothetical protein
LKIGAGSGRAGPADPVAAAVVLLVKLTMCPGRRRLSRDTEIWLWHKFRDGVSGVTGTIVILMMSGDHCRSDRCLVSALHGSAR